LKTKIVWLLFALIGCAVFNGMVEVGQPSIDALIAVDQLEDSEAAALTMRSVSRFENAIPLLSYGAVALFGLLLFYKELTSFVRSAVERI
jgi:hypothetical protein